jgi:quercetin dioxygenase-like cupin family protein
VSSFSVQKVKGVDKLLLAEGIDPERLHIHITEIEAGTRAHPPHIHEGVEAFYVLEGEGTMEVESETYPLHANEAIVLNPGVIHGLVNTGTAKMRYMVITTKP